MTQIIEHLKFTVSLTLSAHLKAKQFARHQSNPQKAEHVYYNTLAVYAVNYYLQYLGFETDLEKSDSWNPVMQSLMDIADLEVKNYGKLECRPVLPDSQVCQFPAEVWSERISYVAVQLNESLTEATLLGLVEKVETKELPLSKLRSLADLPRYLRDTKLVPTSVSLRQWFEEVFAAEWQTLEALLLAEAINPAFITRSAHHLRKIDADNPATDVSAGKLIDLGMQLAGHQVVLIITLVAKADEEVDIRLRVCPTADQPNLPPNLRLSVLDESGATYPELKVKARSEDNWIQLEFSGELGEQFSVKLALGDISITENFVI
ncbi:DUF1822 family protein [Nostoc sp. B(2019)]|nr:DUF1822 family protein [Nostoc sp. B(2019)]